MAGIDFNTARALLFTFGPFVLPRLYTWYKSRRNPPTSTAPAKPIPLPKTVHRSLNILFLSALLFLLSTLPIFSSENIFAITSSRLQTPTDVLFTRLAHLRPNETLTPQDEALRMKLQNMDARCLYLAYGPSTILDCPFCMSDNPKSYFYYALPEILFPHLFQLLVFGLATSGSLAGKKVEKWRTTATCMALGIAVMDVLVVSNIDITTNKRAFHATDLRNYHSTFRLSRSIVLLLSDLLLALLIYLSSTNRLFTTPLTAAERLESMTKQLEQSRGKLVALGIVKNAIVRDEGLSEKGRGYWRREKMVMGEVMEEGEVVEGVRNALGGGEGGGQGRVQIGRVEEEAGRYAEGIVWVGPEGNVGKGGDGGMGWTGGAA